MKPKINFHILTLFPEIFGSLSHSILKRAEDKVLIKIKPYNLRKWGVGKRKQVDDKVYGGGAGMVLKVDVIDKALKDIQKKISARGGSTSGRKKSQPTADHPQSEKIILLTPQGKVFNQKIAKRLAKEKNLILICGHYEGFDERIREYLVDEEISIGDYVLTGGELPAMVLVDAVSRLVPGVLGKEESLKEESFQIQNQKNKTQKLLEYPQYTIPREYKNMRVPDILLSGNHKKIEEWRKAEALKKTKKRRPDLLK